MTLIVLVLRLMQQVRCRHHSNILYSTIEENHVYYYIKLCHILRNRPISSTRINCSIDRYT